MKQDVLGALLFSCQSYWCVFTRMFSSIVALQIILTFVCESLQKQKSETTKCSQNPNCNSEVFIFLAKYKFIKDTA